MTCLDCDLKDADIRHLTRRLEKPDIGYTERRRTADWMRLFDERADLKVEVEKLKRENGELRSRIALLTEMIDE